MGKLIAFEGIDGSGKSTQFRRMTERLSGMGREFRRLVFPRYSEPSCALVNLYLQGRFGSRPEDVNPYVSSSFFAVDRIASYLEDWGPYYRAGGLLLTDRYTTSNAIHQGSKLAPEQRDAYYRWLFDYEYRLLELPRPDAVIYFDMPVETSMELLRRRQSQTGEKADIHEQDPHFLENSRASAHQAARLEGWTIIDCAPGGQLRTEQDIHEEVFARIRKELEV